MEEKMILERGNVRFYSNMFTDTFNGTAKYADAELKMFIAEQMNTKEKDYVLYKGNDAMYARKNFEAVACYADMIILAETL